MKSARKSSPASSPTPPLPVSPELRRSWPRLTEMLRRNRTQFIIVPMEQKKRIARLAVPLFPIGVGIVFIVTQRGSYEGYWTEGPIVIFAGVLLCLLGGWGLILTIRETRRQGQPGRSPSPPLDPSVSPTAGQEPRRP